MKNKVTIYVTLQESDLANERVILFLENYIYSLKHVVRQDYSIFMKGREFFKTDYLETARKSDLFVFIITDGLIENQNFQDEIAEISKLLTTEKDNTTEFQKIFKVCLDPFDNKELPEELQTAITYKFYEFNSRKKTDIPLDPEKDSQKYWGKMLDLVYDLNESVSCLTQPDRAKTSNYVYLATCTDEMASNRDDIKRELQHLGFSVLPISGLSETADFFISGIKKNLEKCRYIFQLVGQSYGVIPEDEKQSFHEIENLVIREYMGSYNYLKRMVWIPANMKLTDNRQDMFIGFNHIYLRNPGFELIQSREIRG